MMNTIIWIDDRDDDMEQIARGAFCELWQHGIFNKTVFLGDYIKEVSAEDCEAYSYTINDILYDLCRDKGVLANEVEEDNGELKTLFNAYQSNYSVTDMATCINDKRNLEYKEQIKSMINSWKKIDSTTKIQNKESIKSNPDYNVEHFFALIDNPSQFVYALDVVLLEGDEGKLNCDAEDRLPVLSMELYHYITKELKCKCLLYSRYTYLNRLSDNWRELYSILYDVNDNLHILSREELYEGSVNQNIIINLSNCWKE